MDIITCVVAADCFGILEKFIQTRVLIASQEVVTYKQKLFK